MNISHNYYVPCLPWKVAEYQALFFLAETTKDLIVPIIEVPEFGYDFEAKKHKKTVEENLKPFAKRVSTKWGGRPFFVDFSYINKSDRLSNGVHFAQFIFNDLRVKKCQGVPVTGFTRDQEYMEVIKEVVDNDRLGLGLRVSLEEIANKEFSKNARKLLHEMKLPYNKCDLIIDMKDPSFEPINGFSRVIQGILENLSGLEKWRNIIILATSLPKSMSEINRGAHIIPRFEWQLYKRLISCMNKSNLRLPTFGDYSIVYPCATPHLDWRIISGAAKIIYSIDDGWLIIKGKKARGNTAQYIPFCRELSGSIHFAGENYSWGDEYIRRCGDKMQKPGLPTEWIKAGTNHHVEKVIDDISKFYAS